jgi:hypothetical protein
MCQQFPYLTVSEYEADSKLIQLKARSPVWDVTLASLSHHSGLHLQNTQRVLDMLNIPEPALR